MVLCEWDALEGDPGQSCVHLFARILSTSFSSVSIFSVCCYSRVSISMVSHTLPFICTFIIGPFPNAPFMCYCTTHKVKSGLHF
jgi:hypothetical protein